MLLRHLRQHVIRRSVDDTHDLGDLVCCQALLQRLDDRDAAADTALIEEIDVMLIRCTIEFPQMFGNDILVGGDHVFARTHGTQHVVLCRHEPAHHLDDDRDLRVIQDLLKVVRKGNPLCLRAVFLRITDENLLDLDACTAAPCDRLPVHRQGADNAGADCPRPQKSYLDCIHRIPSSLTTDVDALFQSQYIIPYTPSITNRASDFIFCPVHQPSDVLTVTENDEDRRHGRKENILCRITVKCRKERRKKCCDNRAEGNIA